MANFSNVTNETFPYDLFSSTELLLNTTAYINTNLNTTESDLFDEIERTLTGLDFTLIYMGLNCVILVIILICACRSGQKKAEEEKLNRRMERELAKLEKENNDIPFHEVELAAKRPRLSSAASDSQYSQYSHYSAFDEKKQNNNLPVVHEAVSSLGAAASAKVCCGAIVEDIANRSFIYSAFLVHVWDQGSDFGVIYTWLFIDDEWKYLGWIAIAIVINYRIFSAYSLRNAQRGWRDTILQVMDFQLFVDVYRSSQEVKPTDSLYWIRAMEAVLESCPQILLQFVYLYEKTDILVWLSLFGSMASVIFSLLHFTDVVFVFQEPEEGTVTKCEEIWLKLKWNIGYISRFLFRFCEVTSRCMVLALIWSTWNNENDETFRLRGTFIVGAVLGLELLFYMALTQLRIPPWEIIAFLFVDIDLTLTFEGRAGALTKPLRHNIFYRCICKPVAEMFTAVTDETVEYYDERHKGRTSSRHAYKKTMPWNKTKDWKSSKHKKKKAERQKLLIAPAHFVYRFLEGVFEIFCVLTYSFFYEEIYDRIFQNNFWIICLASATTVFTPLLYCTVRAFADESKTLERNLIAMVHHGGETGEIIKLIGAGASLKQTDYEGNSIAHACIVKNNKELLRRLIKKHRKYGKDVINLDLRNKKGYTPVLLAAKFGAIDCLKLFAKEKSIDFNQMHVYNGQTVVHIAVEYDRKETVAYLSSLGNKMCNMHAEFSYITESKHQISGYNAIHVAARHNAIECMDVLLGCEVDYKAKLGNGDTAAIVAASRGHTIILQKLFDAGDYFDVTGNFNHTPLYRAALNNHPGTVLVLGRDFHANPDILDEHGVHVVVQCAKRCYFGCLRNLAELGCRFDGCGKYLEKEFRKPGHVDDKMTALMWASKFDYPRFLKILIDSGAKINHENSLGETAAHHAASLGNLDCLKILHSYGANFKLMNAVGQTCYDKAIEQKQEHVVEWLRNKKK